MWIATPWNHINQNWIPEQNLVHELRWSWNSFMTGKASYNSAFLRRKILISLRAVILIWSWIQQGKISPIRQDAEHREVMG